MTRFCLQLNTSKTQIIVFGPPDIIGNIKILGTNLENDINIRFHSSVKNLGIKMDTTLSMEKQVMEIKKKSFRTLRTIQKVRFLLTQDQLKTIVNSLVVSCIDYCNALYFGIREDLIH